ncbi:MAG: trigger factor [Bdellovibrionales bacterium]|nr:trigger factor [Bdellovibrionales bacterium]
MKSTLDKMDGLYRKLNVEVPAEKVQSAFDRIYKGIQQSASIKGFRKGKAPLATIKSLYAEKVQDDVLNDLVSEGYQAALDEHSLNPIGYPKLKFDNLKDGESFSFTAEFEIRPQVEIKKFEGLKVEKEKMIVDDSQIDKILENIQTSQAELVPLFEERPAALGDTADINFDGYVDGLPLQGGKADNHMLELGSGQFIEGFEDKVVGMRIGEEKEINLQFPSEYHNADIAGKPVLFKVKLNALKKKSLPTINDELAKKVGDFETLEALKTAIREDITKNEERRIQEDLRNKVLRKLVEENPIEAPETLKTQQKQMIIEDVKQRLHQQGMSDKDFEDYKEKWANDFEDSAKFMVQSTFLVDALADQLGVRATAKDIEEKISSYAKETGIDIERLNEFYKDGDKRSRLGFQVTEERVVSYLIEKADIKEVEPKKEA